MNNDTVVPAELSGSRIAQAQAFFIDAINEWAEVGNDEDKVKARLKALVTALRTHLRLVVIDLEPGDNAQVIFETLNHRATPLLAADLVRNLVFQVAQSNGLPMETLYTRYWRELDGDYWRQQIAQGRLFRPRIDVFLNHWLTMIQMREVPTVRIFTEFRDGLIVTQQRYLGPLLAELASDAEVYRKMDSLPPESVEGRLQYRVIKAMDTAVVGPLLMWLLRWTAEDLPEAQRHKALNALESWLVRRALCRLTSKDTNKTGPGTSSRAQQRGSWNRRRHSRSSSCTADCSIPILAGRRVGAAESGRGTGVQAAYPSAPADGLGGPRGCRTRSPGRGAGMSSESDRGACYASVLEGILGARIWSTMRSAPYDATGWSRH
jgi:hypothetical protein